MSRRLEWIVPFALLVLAACPRNIPQDNPDAGPTGPQVCVADNECEGYNPTAAVQNVRCDGVCIYLCSGVDAECDSAPDGANRYCNGSGECAIGCRLSSQCAGAGELCVDGVCTTGGSQCASRCDCAAGEVCSEGVCQTWGGGTCTASDQCPRGPTSPVDDCDAVSCNGFGQVCYEESPQACTASADCVGRFGCTGGTTCSCNNNACVPSTSCTVANESTVCGSGNYCDSAGTCQALTTCTQPTDCASGLVCNAGTGRCERSQACTSSADCPIAPNNHCPTGGGFCTVPLCNNGGPACAGGLQCSSQGRCVSPGTGDSCQGDGQCPATAYCDLTESVCRAGCRNNASCPTGQECNGNRQCVSTGGGGQFGDACTDPSECQSPLSCGIFSGTCAESCSDASQCVACNAANGGTCRCNGFGFCTP